MDPRATTPLFADIDDVARRLAETGYLPDTATATAVSWPTGSASRCWSKVPPGSARPNWPAPSPSAPGRAWSGCSATKGVDEARALYEWNHAKQILRIQAGSGDWGTRPRPCVQRGVPAAAAAADRDPAHRTDRAADRQRPTRPTSRSRGLLLEVLSDFAVTVPELRTMTATRERKPFVVLTSNATRELSEALKRRCLFLHIDFPDPDLERRILLSRVPELPRRWPGTRAHHRVLRGMQLKLPSVAETIDWGHCAGAGPGHHRRRHHRRDTGCDPQTPVRSAEGSRGVEAQLMARRTVRRSRWPRTACRDTSSSSSKPFVNKGISGGSV